MTTRSQEVAADIAALLRARNPLLWIVTREEARAEGYIMEAAAAAGYTCKTWDCGQGIADMGGNPRGRQYEDIGETIELIQSETKSGERGVWIMRDLPPWITGPIGIKTCRQLRNLARMLPTVARDNAQAIIVLSPEGNVPPELAGHATVIEWPLPDRNEIASILDATLDALPDAIREKAAPNGTRDAAIDAAVGLSGEEASACYSKSLVQLRRIDPVAVAKEKKRVIARERVLEWFDPIPGGLDAVGGLDNLKSWLVSRRLAYSAKARSYGLPPPRGALLAGISGCGKSLTAKAVATAWGVPLLRMDLGALKSKFVGESEGNLRKALSVIQVIGRCVVWLEEVDKALQGATQGAADGGVSSDALATILTWMQERGGQGGGEAFVIATANRADVLPPEFIRRFDELWFVDLPTYLERDEILRAALRAHGRDFERVNDGTGGAENQWDGLCNATEGFTGAEVASLIPNALYAAFADNEREIEIRDLLQAARKVVPLSKTMAEEIAKLREWAAGRARPATGDQIARTEQAPRLRALDL